MDPLGPGAGNSSITTTSSVTMTRNNPFERRMVVLSEKQGVLLVHLVVWLLAIISGTLLSLRFFAIWHRRLALKVDIGFLIASWNMILFYSILASLELALGIGSQADATAAADDDGRSEVILLDNIARTLVLTALAWSKSSFACSLLGLPGRDMALVHWVLWSIIASVNVLVTGTVIVHWTRCKPIYKAWDMGVDGTCWSMNIHNATQIAAQAYSAFLNLALVAAGYLLVWSNRLRRNEKAGVVVLMALGILASVASIVTAMEILTLTDDNFTKANIRVLLTASIEPNVTIMICSLPALRLLVPSYNDTPHRLDSLRKGRIVVHPAGTSLTNSAADLHVDSSTVEEAAGVGATAPPASRTGTGTGTTAMVTLTTTSPFEGFRPPRPVRPASTRSFLTDASSSSSSSATPLAPMRSDFGGGLTPTSNPFKNSNNTINNNSSSSSTSSINNMTSFRGGKKPVTSSTENLLQAADYNNSSHWNQAIPPSSTTNTTMTSSNNNSNFYNNSNRNRPVPTLEPTLPRLAQQPINPL